MTTKTKPSATDELQQLRQLWADAKAAADDLGRDFTTRRNQAQDLAEDRQHHIRREPGLVDHVGAPVDAGNEIAKIDAELEKVGDLVDLHARFDHARALEARAKEKVDAYIEAHYSQLVDDLRPRAETAAVSVRTKADELLDEVGRYLAVHGEAVALTVPLRTIDGRNVPGVNIASELRRILEPLELPVPLPDPNRRYA